MFTQANYLVARAVKESTSFLNKGRVQKTRLRKMSVMGVPPLPPPSRKATSQKINGKKITEKGGTPPPSRKAAWNFFAENGVFCLKNTVFGPIFNRFFNHGKGGYPPPSRQKAVIGVFEPSPNVRVTANNMLSFCWR